MLPEIPTTNRKIFFFQLVDSGRFIVGVTLSDLFPAVDD